MQTGSISCTEFVVAVRAVWGESSIQGQDTRAACASDWLNGLDLGLQKERPAVVRRGVLARKGRVAQQLTPTLVCWPLTGRAFPTRSK